ncbi:hypothetical protein SNEBB_003433 [Seison nebaliae]|nr:hypothetical protein SNEBB_003433 [Seison nebaliae]
MRSVYRQPSRRSTPRHSSNQSANRNKYAKIFAFNWHNYFGTDVPKPKQSVPEFHPIQQRKLSDHRPCSWHEKTFDPINDILLRHIERCGYMITGRKMCLYQPKRYDNTQIRTIHVKKLSNGQETEINCFCQLRPAKVLQIIEGEEFAGISNLPPQYNIADYHMEHAREIRKFHRAQPTDKMAYDIFGKEKGTEKHVMFYSEFGTDLEIDAPIEFPLTKFCTEDNMHSVSSKISNEDLLMNNVDTKRLTTSGSECLLPKKYRKSKQFPYLDEYNLKKKRSKQTTRVKSESKQKLKELYQKFQTENNSKKPQNTPTDASGNGNRTNHRSNKPNDGNEVNDPLSLLKREMIRDKRLLYNKKKRKEYCAALSNSFANHQFDGSARPKTGYKPQQIDNKRNSSSTHNNVRTDKTY